MITRRFQFATLCAAIVLSACSDSTQPAPGGGPGSPGGGPGGTPEKFVAIGTSISMGWASDGVYAGSQRASWPALMRFGSDTTAISLPLIQSPGCTSPVLAPIADGKRLSGEPSIGSSECAPNADGVHLPAQNVAIAGALASDALQRPPENASLVNTPWYERVLPVGTTQVTAALAQKPTLVSIELGGNEVLKASSGLVIPDGTVVPFVEFEAAFDAVLDAVGAAHPKVLVFGVPTDARKFPLLRRGDAIFADSAEFAALHVDVSSDCKDSPNYVNVAAKSPFFAMSAAQRFAHGLPNPVFSCADIPGATDLVLTPADIDAVNAILAQMADHAKQEAAKRGYAFASLGALYDKPNLQPATYSVIAQLTSATPFGDYISLDGVHPTAKGQGLLAAAAAEALNAKYPGIAALAVAPLTDLSTQLVQPVAPSMALAWVRQLAAANRGDQLPTCGVPGGCFLTARR